MKKRLLVGTLFAVLILLLAACGCDHEWMAATCTAPKTCQLCAEVEGEALGHVWQAADCVTAKTCTVCKDTEGEPLGHSWQEADCLAPKTCTVCKVTEGEPLGHDWQEATTEDPETCSRCSLTQGGILVTDSRFTTKLTKILHGTWTSEVNLTREMMGINVGFENGVDCILVLEFGKTGEMSIHMEMKDEDAFLAELKTVTTEIIYEAFQQRGMSKEQADQEVQKEYGMTVEQYVEKQLKSYDFASMFQAYRQELNYYVYNDGLYVGLSWTSEFERSEFSLVDGVLSIVDLVLAPDEEPLLWKKAE